MNYPIKTYRDAEQWIKESDFSHCHCINIDELLTKLLQYGTNQDTAYEIALSYFRNNHVEYTLTLKQYGRAKRYSKKLYI